MLLYGARPDGWTSWGTPRWGCHVQHTWSKSNLGAIISFEIDMQTWWNSAGWRCQCWGIGSHTQTQSQCSQLHAASSEERRPLYEKERRWRAHFEWDEISPHSWSVRWLDLIVEVVQDNVIDELIPIHLFVQKWLSDYQAEDLSMKEKDFMIFWPCKDLSYLSDSTLSNLHPESF